MKNLEEILIEIDNMSFLESSAVYGIFFIVIVLIVGVLHEAHKEDKKPLKRISRKQWQVLEFLLLNIYL